MRCACRCNKASPIVWAISACYVGQAVLPDIAFSDKGADYETTSDFFTAVFHLHSRKAVESGCAGHCSTHSRRVALPSVGHCGQLPANLVASTASAGLVRGGEGGQLLCNRSHHPTKEHRPIAPGREHRPIAPGSTSPPVHPPVLRLCCACCASCLSGRRNSRASKLRSWSRYSGSTRAAHC